MESTCAQTYVKGYLLLNHNNAEEEDHDKEPHDILHESSTCIRIIGKEWITDSKDDSTILIDDSFHLPTYEWQYHPEQRFFTLPFDIPLPRDIPITWVGRDSGIDYVIRAQVRRLKNIPFVVDAARPLILLRGPPLLTIAPSSTCSSSSSLSSLLSPLPSLSPSLTSSSSLLSSTSSSSALLSPFFKSYTLPSSSSISPSIEGLANNRSRLCWGMSARSQWQYELELPQLIDASQPFSFTLRTRIRQQSLSKNSSLMESCMIGIQVYESIHVGSKPSINQVLMTTSNVLTEPSRTWSSPCAVTLELDQLPKSSTLCSPRIKVDHHFQITLSYCSAQGQSDRVHFSCIIPLITIPTPSLPMLCSSENTVNTLMKMMSVAKQSDQNISPLCSQPRSDFILNSIDTHT
ncbi:unnamed protein product [Absidia cylindrospora]